MELKETFGETVRSIQRSKVLDQGETGTNQGFISELESGLKAPTLLKIAEMAKNLDLTQSHFSLLHTKLWDQRMPRSY
jgi:hypothetical protein